MTLKDNFPVKFNNQNDSCDRFDERTYCQMVEQGDEINFAWSTDQIGTENLINCCPDFDTESCATGESCNDNDGMSGGWTDVGLVRNYGGIDRTDSGLTIVCFGDPDGFLANGSMSQVSAIPGAGTYKVIITIPAYPVSSYYQGSFSVTLGNVTSDIIAVAPGTYNFYLSPTTGTSISINAINAVMCVDLVEVYEYCSDFSINIHDKDGNFIKNITDFITTYQNQVFFKAQWSDLSLENGCYYFCIVNECSGDGEELVINGNFSSSSGWTQGIGWAIGSNLANHSGPSDGILSRTISLLPNTAYLIEFDYTFNSAIVTLLVIGGDAIATFNTAGHKFYSFTTGSNPAQSIAFLSSGDGGILGANCTLDNVSVKPAEIICSTCYDLKDEHPCTKLITWTNDDDGFGIPYSSVEFNNSLRIYAFIEKPRYPTSSDRFAFSDGRRKILYATSEKIWIFFVDYLPEYLHDALAVAKIHDHFYIDGVEYICTSDEYVPEWRNRLKLAQGRFDIQKVIDNNKNKNC